MIDEVKAFDRYASNGDLMLACRRLGYLSDSMSILDVTYGWGTFWKEWRPPRLVGHDLNPEKSPGGRHPGNDGRTGEVIPAPIPPGRPVDFRRTPYPDRAFQAVVFDGPYKLNGTPSKDDVDARYGVEVPARWQDRMTLLEQGAREAARVASEIALVKCQDQVVSRDKRWQTRVLADVVEAEGFTLLDMLHKEGGRPQPLRKCHDCKKLPQPWHLCPKCKGAGEYHSQKRSRGNYSTLLVLRRNRG